MSGAPARLILVWQADPQGAYGWLPAQRPGDVVVSFDALAAEELAGRDPVEIDRVMTWEDREAAERRVGSIVAALRVAPALAGLQIDGYPLVELMEYRARAELAHVLRGWTAGALAPGATAVVVDPSLPASVVIGARAALGLDPGDVAYVSDYRPFMPPPLQRTAFRAVMRSVAAVSRGRGVRIAAVASGAVVPALTAVGTKELRRLGVGTMPFPGLNYGTSALVAARLRIPMLDTLEPRSLRSPAMPQPAGELALDDDPALNRAVRTLLDGLMREAWPQLAAMVHATRGLDRARSLRALILPQTAFGASRILLNWARRRDVTVAAVQHGVYAYKEFDGGDSRADVIYSWGRAVEAQTREWPAPHPRVVSVGVPGASRAPARARPDRIRHVLVATSSRPIETALNPAALHEWFVAVVVPGIRRLREAGVAVEMRLHPQEAPEPYRRILDRTGLDIDLAPSIPFHEAALTTDVLVTAPSSVAFEAAALGLPVLMWMAGLGIDRWREHFIAPWTEELPGTFDEPEEFEALAAGLVQDGAPSLALATQLSERLAPYGELFDAGAFAADLERLGA